MINFIKRTLNAVDLEGNTRQWIIKMNGDKISEVKMIYEVSKYKGKRVILNDEQLLEFLIDYNTLNK
tara:strand:+ start:789 stop:989 length:201 start_codon:yes stop_codon:yes gene_type:complete